MGHKFTMILNREITDDESGILREAGCADADITTVPLPGRADVVVTQLDFDTDMAPSLAESIESALEAVKKVPDLSVPTLTVPAQPAPPADADGDAPGGTIQGEVVADEPAAEADTPASGGEASDGKALDEEAIPEGDVVAAAPESQ